MSFSIKNEKILEKCNKVWDSKKFSNNIKKGFDSEPVYNEKYLKTKIKSYEGEIITNFHSNEVPKRKLSIHLPISNID